MYDLLVNLVLNKQLEFGDGTIKIFRSHNAVFFPLSNLFSIIKIVDDLGKSDELYESSKKLGEEWIMGIFKAYKMDTIDEQASWGEKIISLAGFGKLKIYNWDVKKKEMYFKVENSQIAQLYGRVGKPVDHLLRGWFAGVSSIFFKSPIECAEIKCMSKGDEYCEFFAAPKETLKKMKLM
jgi:predicted hydrocarbon binding protein